MKQILDSIKQFAKINSANHIFEVPSRKNLFQKSSTSKIKYPELLRYRKAYGQEEVYVDLANKNL